MHKLSYMWNITRNRRRVWRGTSTTEQYQGGEEEDDRKCNRWTMLKRGHCRGTRSGSWSSQLDTTGSWCCSELSDREWLKKNLILN